MERNGKLRRASFGRLAGVFVVLVALGAGSAPGGAAPDQSQAAALRIVVPLRIVVMDPLCDRLACDCVAGYARRNYGKLGEFLETQLHRKVDIAYAESLASPQVHAEEEIDLVIGKFSVVRFDAAKARLNLRTVAMLSGKDGSVTQTGLFVVRQADAARSIEGLQGRQILLGPEDSQEKRSAALAAMEAFGLAAPEKIVDRQSCNAAAMAVAEEDADAAVVSSYAMPLLEGCGTVDKGVLRIVGRTDRVPFIGVLATDRVGPAVERDLVKVLLAVGDHPELLAAMESKSGFFRLPDLQPDGWPDWRGRGRHAISKHVPETLPPEKRLLWEHTMTGPGMSGLAVGEGCVVTADKDLDDRRDVFRCLDADTGRQLWTIVYPAAGKMDYTNSPRANPVICDRLVYLLGAFGDLHCVELDSGRIVWKKHLVNDFDAKLPMWGYSSTPLAVGRKLIVNPGAKQASIVALDRLTGELLWSTPGDPPGYASFVLAELGGQRQLVGYDAISLGGWDPDSGKRLWRLVPEFDGDFNVPTPIVVGDKLLVTTENNGTRLYGFDRQGQINPEPVAFNEDLAPDTATPVVIDGMVLASFGGLWCLDLDNGLETLWESDEDALAYHCTLIAGNGRVLVMTQSGKLYLLAASKKGFSIISTIELFQEVAETERDVWSHPALVGNRLYVRNLLGVYCFLID